MGTKRKPASRAGGVLLQPRLRVLYAGKRAFGPGKAELLQAIASGGSIRSAAARLSMSYNRAWTLVREMNAFFRRPLVIAERGGGTGGGATLTETGKEVLGRYLVMERLCRESTRAEWQRLRRLLR